VLRKLEKVTYFLDSDSVGVLNKVFIIFDLKGLYYIDATNTHFVTVLCKTKYYINNILTITYCKVVK